VTTSTPEIERVLAAWGRSGARVVALDSEAGDRWRVEDGEQAALLRRYADDRAADALAFQHDLLAFLAERAWPVPAPIATAAGGTAVEADGARWSLTPLLPGTPPPDESIFLQRRGALLALIHADLREWDGTPPPVATRRVDDFDGAVQAHGLASFEALLARVQVVDAMRANILAVLRMRIEEQLAAYRYGELPTLPLWGGCSSQHVLFDGNDVTGLIDFDHVRADARAVDVAESILADTRSIGWRIIRWVAGYAAHAQPPLSAQEADLVPVLMAALMLRRVAATLAEAHAGERLDADALACIDEAMTVEANEDDLREVIRTAARIAPL